MDLFLQLNQFLTDDNAVGSEFSSLIKATLEKMMIDVARKLMPAMMEPIIRKVVKEELVVALEKVLPSMKMNSGSKGSTSESPSLQLRFLSKISPEVWTGRKKGEENFHIEVALIDGRTGEVVKSGPEAEAKVEIVALDGGSDGIGEGDNCTSEEFNNNIVRECEGKKSILRGNTYLKLKEGKCFSNDISFTHSKDWMKNREFRLGAKIVDSVFTTTVEEAKTESFILKDRRSTLNKKHYPPLPSDEVWRLEKIQREGAYHRRLTKANIKTVKDFLTLFTINPKKLQNILEVCDKIWKVIVDHAQTCPFNEGIYMYNDPSYDQNTVVVFNTDGRLMGLNIRSQYVPVDQLSEDKKADGQKSVKSASEHWELVVSLKDEASLRHANSQSANTVGSFSSSTGESSAGPNNRIPPSVSDQGSPNGLYCGIPPSVSDQGSPNGLYCGIPPLAGCQSNWTISSCRIPPLVSAQESPNSKNQPLVSDQGNLTGYNCINPPLFTDPELPSPLFSDQDCPTITPPLIDNRPQPNSSCLVFTHSFDRSGSANNFDYDNMESHIFAWQSNDLPISSPEANEEFLQYLNTDHILQQEIPNVDMHPEQQGSPSSILLTTSQEVCFDQNQKILCKMVRQLSIRIGATEPEAVHIEKKQRGC